MKLLELPHKVCGVTCMINGLEDLYEYETGVRLPDWLLMFVSGMINFVYIKNKNAPAQRMVFWGSQVAKYQYEALADVVGFRWQMLENRGFEFTLKRAREAIDQGSPALLGALDMYHLPYYEKFYHKIHVPIHHVLMVGYDDAREVVLVQDCDRMDIQEIPYIDLEAAWDVTIPGLGKKNTFYTFSFGDHISDIEAIARKGLHKRAIGMLQAPTSMFGIKGMRKLARELPNWPGELSAQQLDSCLRHLAEFTGMPPVLPTRLIGPGAPDKHTAGRDVFAGLLRQLADDFHVPAWREAAELFDQSGEMIVMLTDEVVDMILGEVDSLEPAGTTIAAIADLEEEAFGRVRDGC